MTVFSEFWPHMSSVHKDSTGSVAPQRLMSRRGLGSGRVPGFPAHLISACRNRVLLLIVVVSVMSAGWAGADKAADDFRLGVGLFRSGRWEIAADTFRQFLKDNPEHSRRSLARLYLGLSLSSLERFAEARPEFTAFLEAEPDSEQAGDARYRLGESSYYLRDYAAAAAQLDTFLEKHPQHKLSGWGRLFRGDSLNGLERWDEAEEVLQGLLDAGPPPQILRDTQFGLARAVESQKKTDAAMLLYQEVASDTQSPLAPRALARIGTIQFNRQQYPEAAASYDAIVRQFPDSSLTGSARLNSGLALFRSRNFQAAVERFRQVPGDSPGSAQAVLMTALSLKELGQLADARKSFNDALTAAGNSPLAADILFQRASLERADNQKDLAAQIFEDLADRWPNGANAAESLFSAAELHLELGSSETAHRLWERLAEEFPSRAAAVREQVLLGRICLARGELPRAVETLRKVLSEGAAGTSDPTGRMPAVARYHLIRALFDSEEHDAVTAETRILLDSLGDGEMRDLRAAVALAAMSSLRRERFAEAREFADRFLADADDVSQKADVLAARAVALTHLREFPAARADMTILTEKHPERPQTWRAILQAAQAASELNEHGEAGGMFALAAGHAADPVVHEAALTGMAWSLFRERRYDRAEEAFGQLTKAYPESEDAARSVYMQARCVEEQGATDRAAAAYQQAFSRLTADMPDEVQDIGSSPRLQFAFDAGRQAARILGRQKQFDAADHQWELLTQRFPRSAELERVLDEWAGLNLTAERYLRADEIHRRLLERFPDGIAAGRARLSLAESALTALTDSELRSERLEQVLGEFRAIVDHSGYDEAEKERALFHIIDIQVLQRDWAQVREFSLRFLQQFESSPFASQVRLMLAEASLNTVRTDADVDAAVRSLTELQQQIVTAGQPSAEWTERIWVVLAEGYLLKKDYAAVDRVAELLLQRAPETRFAFQMYDVQGRRWKAQAPPDFERARSCFRQAIEDRVGAGTETAARCQFQIAETFLLEKNFDQARKEYYQAYLNYPYPLLREQALYQAAGCELRLQKKDDAIQSFQEFLRVFPASELTTKVKGQLRELGADPS